MNDLETAARSYLSAGLSVIALSGKAPNAKYHPEGLNTPLSGIPEDDADNALIEQLFTDPSTTGIGIPIPPHMVVVDIDGEEGAVLYREIIGNDAALVPDTPVAMTGRGLHIWFATAKVYRTTVLGPKLDLKGVGGYVAAPPSKHPDGGTYRWLESLIDGESGQRVNVDWIPEEVEKRLDELASAVASQNDYRPGWDMELDPKSGRFRIMPLKPNLDGLKRSIIEAPDGNQNAIIAWAAMTARDEGVPFDLAYAELMEASLAGNHPRKRANDTIKAAYKRGKR